MQLFPLPPPNFPWGTGIRGRACAWCPSRLGGPENHEVNSVGHFTDFCIRAGCPRSSSLWRKAYGYFPTAASLSLKCIWEEAKASRGVFPWQIQAALKWLKNKGTHCLYIYECIHTCKYKWYMRTQKILFHLMATDVTSARCLWLWPAWGGVWDPVTSLLSECHWLHRGWSACFESPEQMLIKPRLSTAHVPCHPRAVAWKRW